MSAQDVGVSAEIYNLRGLKCPLPVLKTQKKLRDLTSGERIWVETDDPLAVIDVPHFCQEKSHPLIEMVELDDGGHRFLIERGA
ncbi:MAG: sulfurtransferase TusA family protein [Pseudomonadota bacterium]